MLKDLDLLEKVFDFFPKIAISQAALSELSNMSHVFSGSIFRERCVALQDVLKSHLAQILQPRGTPSAEDRLLPPAAQEMQSLAKTGDYLIYSDDAVLRLWLLEDKFKSDGICTLDLLCGLEEIGLLTAEEVATKLAQLCDWNVGIQIQLRHQLALIPQAVRVASSVAKAAALLREVEPFMSMARGIWGEPVNFMDTTAHVGAVVRLLVQDSSMTNVAIGAFFAAWIDHATARTDMPLPSLRLVPQIVLYAVATDKLPIAATRRLWIIYFGVVESIQGHLDTQAVREALARVAYEAGSLDKRIAKERVTTPTTVGQRLMMGLDVNSSAWVAFCSTYVRGRN